ncbi:hypothetical protein T492DRAFT_977927, partial [Pavlovales sp. CCMP2436]
MSVARIGQVRLVIDEVRAAYDVARHLASRGRLSAPPRPTGGEQEACHLWAKDVHTPRRARSEIKKKPLCPARDLLNKPSRAGGHRRQPELHARTHHDRLQALAFSRLASAGLVPRHPGGSSPPARGPRASLLRLRGCVLELLRPMRPRLLRPMRPHPGAAPRPTPCASPGGPPHDASQSGNFPWDVTEHHLCITHPPGREI